MIEKILPYGIAFLGALVLTLILTPIVREVNRKLGMVDKPDPRRINKVPIPRGGGVALFLGAVGSYLIFIHCEGMPWLPASAVHHTARLPLLATAIFLIGLWDDKFGMPPKVKLLGQLVIAFLVWWWVDLGFSDLWPSIPMWIDAVLTVFWIAGAINAFNLIDGLDGLASGLALIATLGMAGALMFSGRADYTSFHLAFAGALLGFLRYNYNPASVFLGDSGSMYIGFVLSTLPLAASPTATWSASLAPFQSTKTANGSPMPTRLRSCHMVRPSSRRPSPRRISPTSSRRFARPTRSRTASSTSTGRITWRSRTGRS